MLRDGAYVPSSFSRILTQRNSGSSCRQPSAPHTLILQRRQELAHFHLHAVGDGLDLHADRIHLTVSQAYRRLSCVPGRQRRTVERQRPGLAVHRQHATTGADTA